MGPSELSVCALYSLGIVRAYVFIGICIIEEASGKTRSQTIKLFVYVGWYVLPTSVGLD